MGKRKTPRPTPDFSKMSRDSLLSKDDVCVALGHISISTLDRYRRDKLMNFPLPVTVGKLLRWRYGGIIDFAETQNMPPPGSPDNRPQA